jgi:hypothetical protein
MRSTGPTSRRSADKNATVALGYSERHPASAGCRSVMRVRTALLLPLAAAVLWPVSSLAAQAVDRTDTPRRGALRVTFDPETMTWERNFTPAGRAGIGAALNGDSAAATVPSVALIQQDTRTLTGLAGYIASLGHDLLAIRAERRVMPIGLEYGISNRLSLGLVVPIVRVQVRTGYALHPPGGDLGFGPRTSADSARYTAFFSSLGTALAALNDSIHAISNPYGCPSAACARAEATLAFGDSLSQTLSHAVFGTQDTTARYLPVAGSDAGRQITALIAGLQHALADTFHVSSFSNDAFVLPATSIADPADIAALYAARTDSLGLAPYGDTPRRLRFFAGDVEVQAKLRLLVTDNAAAAAALVVRLPTGHQDSPNDPFDIATGDHQTDLEGRFTGEVTLLHRLWLNGSLRVARQLPGPRVRRVGPADDPFLPATSLARLRWDPGDYVALDVAPMFRFSRRFAAGFTASYYAQGQDRYGFFSPQDSVAFATQIGGPADVSVLDAGTAIRWTRLGVAVTYAGPRLEGGFSVEQTVSGAGGLVPVATVFRIVMRQTILLF